MRKTSPQPALVSDALFARRVYLDVWGLLPPPEQLQAFLADRTSGQARRAGVRRCWRTTTKYAEHWISFWNDLLRNEDGVSYFSETAGRKSITRLAALRTRLATCPTTSSSRSCSIRPEPADPDGFLIGVNWRGETSAAVTPWMQASQNTAQVFLGVNLKCNSCHDSFVSKWKLKDAYALAAYFSPEPTLQLYRCDVAQDELRRARLPLPGADPRAAFRRRSPIGAPRPRRSSPIRATAGCRARSSTASGSGCSATASSPTPTRWTASRGARELLDWLASDFVEHGYDLKHLIADDPDVARVSDAGGARDGRTARRAATSSRGPEVRRLTRGAVRRCDWRDHRRVEAWIRRRRPAAYRRRTRRVRRDPRRSQATAAGVYGRDWRVASTDLTRALGRPIRDQVISVRAAAGDDAAGAGAGERRDADALAVARRAADARRTAARAGQPLQPRRRRPHRDVECVRHRHLAARRRLWLVVQETGSNAPELVQPAWAQAELVVRRPERRRCPSLTPVDGRGLRPGDGPIARAGRHGGRASVCSNPSVLVYDIAGRGFTRFRGVIGLENTRSEIGSTLNPQVRFFVFDTEPNMDRLLPPLPGTPLPRAAAGHASRRRGDRSRLLARCSGALRRAAERQIAEATLTDPSRPRPRRRRRAWPICCGR